MTGMEFLRGADLLLARLVECASRNHDNADGNCSPCEVDEKTLREEYGLTREGWPIRCQPRG